jgi:hypothetical protein
MNKSISEKPSGEMPLGFYFSVSNKRRRNFAKKTLQKVLDK